jgi:hypothetical protein
MLDETDRAGVGAESTWNRIPVLEPTPRLGDHAVPRLSILVASSRASLVPGHGPNSSNQSTSGLRSHYRTLREGPSFRPPSRQAKIVEAAGIDLAYDWARPVGTCRAVPDGPRPEPGGTRCTSESFFKATLWIVASSVG